MLGSKEKFTERFKEAWINMWDPTGYNLNGDFNPLKVLAHKLKGSA